MHTIRFCGSGEGRVSLVPCPFGGRGVRVPYTLDTLPSRYLPSTPGYPTPRYPTPAYPNTFPSGYTIPCIPYPQKRHGIRDHGGACHQRY